MDLFQGDPHLVLHRFWREMKQLRDLPVLQSVLFDQFKDQAAFPALDNGTLSDYNSLLYGGGRGCVGNPSAWRGITLVRRGRLAGRLRPAMTLAPAGSAT